MRVEKRYSPEFKVFLAGREAPAELRRVMSAVSFTTGFDGADRVEVTIANQALRWLDSDELRLDQSFALWMGYVPDGVVPMFAGQVTGVSASFPSSGVPQLTLTAQDRRHRMQKGQPATWHADATPVGVRPRPDALVAAAVAATHGLRVEPDPVGAKLAAIVAAVTAVATAEPDAGQKAVPRQMKESDYDFLRRVARENGFELLVEHTGPEAGAVLRLFSPLGRRDPEVDLEYGLSLIEFTPRETTVGQVAAVRTNVWVPPLKREIGLSIGVSGDPPGLTLTVGPARADDPQGVVLLNEPLTPATAPKRLLGELMPRLNEQFTGSGSAVGDPRIRAGTVLRLAGLGERFGGLYRVKSATHSIDAGGYRTRFEVRREVWLADVPKAVQKAVRVRRPPAVKVHL